MMRIWYNILVFFFIFSCSRPKEHEEFYEVAGLPNGDKTIESFYYSITIIISGFIYYKILNYFVDEKTQQGYGCLPQMPLIILLFALFYHGFPILCWLGYIKDVILTIGFILFIVFIVSFLIYEYFKK